MPVNERIWCSAFLHMDSFVDVLSWSRLLSQLTHRRPFGVGPEDVSTVLYLKQRRINFGVP